MLIMPGQSINIDHSKEFNYFWSILAVADGVGGWADHGVDPALYSKELC